jgi:uncharacterized cupin superfamily protein
VFVSKASTGEWEPDPDVPGSEMHELVHLDGVWAGLTRFTRSDGAVPWTPEQREVALILEGSVRIEIAGGDTLELEEGDLFSLPPGVETTWHVSTPFKEMWVLASS